MRHLLGIDRIRTERVRFGVEDGPLAQLVEQLTFNQWVAGSNPARLTILPPRLMIFVFFLEDEIIRRHGRRQVHKNLEIGGGIAINIRLNDIEIISTPSEIPQLPRYA